MLMRIRWFVLGVLSTVGAGAYLGVKRLRRRLTPAGMGRASLHAVADSLDAAARRIDPSGRSIPHR